MASRKDSKGRMLKLGESERPNKTYEYRYKDPATGKRVSIYKPTLQELREAEKIIQRMIDEQVDILRGNRTLEQQMDIFLQVKQSRLREGSRKTYITAINTIDSSPIAKTKIRLLTTTNIKTTVIGWHLQGLSSKYIRLCYALLRNALQLAYEDGYIAKNPCSFQLGSVLPDREELPRKPLTKQEKNDLLQMLQDSKKSKDVFYFHVVRILCETGLRIGEFRGLRIADVDFENSEINVHHQLSRQGTYDLPKTKCAVRKIPLTEAAASSLRFLIDRAGEIRSKTGNREHAGHCDFIAISEKGIPVDYYAYARAFSRFEKEYQDQYGKEIEVSPHICRHTFSSNCVAGGLPPKTLQQLMGHASFQISMDVYTELEYSVVKKDFFRAAAAL